MNAGAYGGEMRQVVTEVTALLPEGVRRFTAAEAAFGYRRSAFLDTEAVVLGARLRLTPDDPASSGSGWTISWLVAASLSR